jgi:hypothetical protein
MAVVKMFVQKFGREVLIDEHHPLAIAQHAHNAKPATADTSSASAPAASVAPVSPVAPDATVVPVSRKKAKR